MRHDFVATGFVFTPQRDKVLLIFHNKLQKWLPPGGHLKPNELPHRCALREVKEETGIEARLIPYGEQFEIEEEVESQLPTPFVMLHEFIPASAHDEAHMHIDFIFLMELVQESAELAIAPSEVKAARWMTLDEVRQCDTFDSVIKICQWVMNPS
jgi:ADP-ribose pyrophosphatase YjhB (NUDIX family)